MAPAKHKPHPNRVAFEGILTRINTPSDLPVGRAEGHRVLITPEAAQDALSSLEGMGVGFTADFARHDHRMKCGVITHAWIKDDAIAVRGHVYGYDFPEIARELSKPGAEYGMSYEMAEAEIEDQRDPVWRVTRCIFSGAALLLRNKAAYRKTLFSLSASAEEDTFNGYLTMVTEAPITLTLE